MLRIVSSFSYKYFPGESVLWRSFCPCITGTFFWEPLLLCIKLVLPLVFVLYWFSFQAITFPIDSSNCCEG